MMGYDQYQPYRESSRMPSRRDLRMRKIVEILQNDSRAQLTDISKALGIPTSTVFDYMKDIRREFEFTIVRKGMEM